MAPRGLAYGSVSENHVYRYYCLKSFCCLKIWKNASNSSIFAFLIMPGKSMNDSQVLKQRAKTYVILMSLNCVHFYARYW